MIFFDNTLPAAYALPFATAAPNIHGSRLVKESGAIRNTAAPAVRNSISLIMNTVSFLFFIEYLRYTLHLHEDQLRVLHEPVKGASDVGRETYSFPTQDVL